MNKKLPHDHGQNVDKLLETLPEAEDFSVVSALFKQLADSSRVRLFWILCHYEGCVANLSELMNMSSPALSHHLRQLKMTGLITSRRDGKEVYYRAADTEIAQTLHKMTEKLIDVSCPMD